MRPRYHVFLSHSSADKPAVEEIALKLREAGIEPFLDKWDLPAGQLWQKELDSALERSDAFVVFIGSDGLKGWQEEETLVALDRQKQKTTFPVIPVLLPGLLNSENILSFLRQRTWVDFRAGLKDEAQLRRLINGIRGEGPDEEKSSPAVYRSMAIPPEDFVHRREYDRVVEALCSENHHGSTVGITTALRGAGGFGKTALAQAVCQDERVRRKYPDGILWTTMGEEVSESGRVSRLRDLIRWWAKAEPPVFETIDSASAFLRDLLGKAQVLLVVDDTWSDLDLIPFKGLCSALLITTREKDILPSSAERIDVDAMDVPEAVNLLRAGLPEWEIATFRDLAQRLGEWPLLLTLVNRQLREMVEEDGFTIGEALENVESTLQAEGLTAFDRENSQARQSAVEKTLAVSLRRLQDSDLARFCDLAVFPEDEEITVSVLERFWGSSRGETERLCQRLDNLSLLLRFDRRKGILQIHDVVRHYMVHRERGQISNLHRRFLEAFRPQSGFWNDLPEEEGYLWRHLGYHLLEAGEKGTLRDLLFNYSYLQAKLRATDVNALIANYDPLAAEDDELGLIQATIRMSSHILAKNHEQLSPHLLGRLLGAETHNIQHLLHQCRRVSALRPRLPSFRPPGPLFRVIEVGSIITSAVVVGRRAVSGSDDGMLRILDLETGKILRTLKGQNEWINVIKAVDGQHIISGSDDGTLRIWELETGKTLRILNGHKSGIRAIAVVSGRYAVSSSEDEELRVWDLETGQTLRTLTGHSDKVQSLATLDGRRVISGSNDGTLRIWDLDTGKTLQTIKVHSAEVRSLALIDERRIFSGFKDGNLRIFDLGTGECLRTLKGHYAEINTMLVIGGVRAISGSKDGTLRIWNLETGESIRILEGYGDSVWAVGKDGLCAVSGSEDGTLRVWDLESGQTIRALEGQENPIWTVGVDSRHVISGSDNGIRVLDLKTGEIIRIIKGYNSGVSALATVDNRRAISGFMDGTLQVLDLESGQTLRTLEGHKASVTAVAIVDGRRAVSGSNDGTLQLWNLEVGQSLHTLEGHNDRVMAVAIVDNQRAISASNDGTLRVWNLESGQILRTLKGHKASVTAVALVDSQRAVSGSDDWTLRVWDLETGQHLRILEGHTDWITAVAVVDGRLAVSSSEDRTLRVWNLGTGECLTVLVLEAGVTSVAVAPDQRTVVAGDRSGRVHFLELDIAALN